jgi:hypothetical protein
VGDVVVDVLLDGVMNECVSAEGRVLGNCKKRQWVVRSPFPRFLLLSSLSHARENHRGDSHGNNILCATKLRAHFLPFPSTPSNLPPPPTTIIYFRHLYLGNTTDAMSMDQVVRDKTDPIEEEEEEVHFAHIIVPLLWRLTPPQAAHRS